MADAMDISKALYIWSCLERARDKIHPYGGDIAEVYVQHLLPPDFNPALGKELWLQASRSLYRILVQFSNINNVDVRVNGRAIGKWMQEYQLLDKCEVQIVARKTE